MRVFGILKGKYGRFEVYSNLNHAIYRVHIVFNQHPAKKAHTIKADLGCCLPIIQVSAQDSFNISAVGYSDGTDQ
jgi:hypothetical protein